MQEAKQEEGLRRVRQRTGADRWNMECYGEIHSSAGPLLMTCQWLGIPKPWDRVQKALSVHRVAEEGLWIGSL